MCTGKNYLLPAKVSKKKNNAQNKMLISEKMAAYSALHMLYYGHTSIIKRKEQELIEQLSPLNFLIHHSIIKANLTKAPTKKSH